MLRRKTCRRRPLVIEWPGMLLYESLVPVFKLGMKLPPLLYKLDPLCRGYVERGGGVESCYVFDQGCNLSHDVPQFVKVRLGLYLPRHCQPGRLCKVSRLAGGQGVGELLEVSCYSGKWREPTLTPVDLESKKRRWLNPTACDSGPRSCINLAIPSTWLTHPPMSSPGTSSRCLFSQNTVLFVLQGALASNVDNAIQLARVCSSKSRLCCERLSCSRRKALP